MHKPVSLRSRLQLIILLGAWLLATGVHWDVVQVVGWSRMMAGSVRSMPIMAAVRQTFDPQEMCGVCDAVQGAKREQRETSVAAGSVEGKAPLVIQPVPLVIVPAPQGQRWDASETAAPFAECDAPPVPPPRGTEVDGGFSYRPPA